MRWRRGSGEDTAVYRITGARQSLTDDINARQRRYVISMLIRTVAVIMTVVLWDVSRPVAVVALVLGAVIPYVAVVVANGGRAKAAPLPTAHLAHGDLRALPPAGPRPRPGGAEGADGPRRPGS